MNRSVFFKNASVLAVTNLVIRGLGMLFMIYLSNQIGAEGIGIYQIILSAYSLFITAASSGIPIAATRITVEEMTTGSRQSVCNAQKKMLLFSFGISTATAALLFFGAAPISHYWLKEARAVLPLQLLSLSIPFIALSCVLRGYFMARRKTGIPAASQLFEQLFRIAVIFFLLSTVSQDISKSISAVAIGTTLSEVASCLFVWIGYRWDKRHLPPCGNGIQTPQPVLRRMNNIMLPISAGSSLNSVLRFIESTMVPNRLSGFLGNRSQALAAFGALRGMSLPILLFPSSFLNAFSTLLVPEITEAHALGQTKKQHHTITLSLQVCLLVSILISGVFTLYAYEIGDVIYQNQSVGYYLRVLSPLIPLMYTENIVDGILKGLNQQVSSLRYRLIDSGLRIAMIALLVPRYGMDGFLFIMIFSNLLTFFLNLFRLIQVTDITLSWWQICIKPMGCILVSMLFAFFITSPLQQALHFVPILILLLGGSACSLFYLGMLFFTRCLPSLKTVREMLQKRRTSFQ